MPKKSLNLLVLAGTLITPIIGTPLLVSCKNIDYEQDIVISFKENKSTFFASDVLDKITFKSKSNKVKYTPKLIKSDDVSGEVILSITPNYKGTKKSFTLKLSGFAKKLEAILKQIEEFDLQDKDKHKVEDYITSFGNDLTKKLAIKTSIGKNLQDFLHLYNLTAKFTLEPKDAKKGIATLKSEFSLENQKQTLETEISGFKTNEVLTKAIEKIKSITPPIDLKEKDGKTVNDYVIAYANLKDQIVFTIEGKTLEVFLTEQGIQIENISLKPEEGDGKSGILEIKLKKETDTETFSQEINGFKEDITLTEIIAKINSQTPAIDLKEKDGKTVNNYVATYSSNLKEQIIFTIEGKTLEEWLTSVNAQIEAVNLKVKAEDSKIGILEIKLKKHSETKTLLQEISGFIQDLTLDEIITKINAEATPFDLKDKNDKTIAQYINDHLLDLKDQIEFKVETIAFEEWLNKNSATIDNVSLTAKEDGGTIAILEIKISKNSETKIITREISGFKADTTLEQIITKIQTLTPPIDLADKSTKTVSQYGTQFQWVIHSQINNTIDGKNFVEWLTSFNTKVESSTLTSKAGTNNTGILEITLKRAGQTKSLSVEITGFLADMSLEEIFTKLEVATPKIDLKDKTGKTVKKYLSEFGTKLKKQIDFKIDTVEFSTWLEDQGANIEEISLKEKDTDSKIGILEIKIAKGSDSRIFNNEISGFEENKLPKAFEEDLKLDGVSDQQTVAEYITQHTDLTQKVITATKDNSQYKIFLSTNNIEFENVTLKALGGGKAALTVKVKDATDPSNTLEKSFEISGFKAGEPATIEEAAEQGLLITADKSASTYEADVTAIKEWFKTNASNTGHRRFEQSDDGWTLKKTRKDKSPLKIGKSILFNAKWGTYKDRVRSADNSGNYGQMQVEKDGSGEITKIFIEYTLTGGTEKYTAEIWKQ
ncbi:hypothetical protein PR240_03170 [Metamycoplasma hyosynoviae]|uniref:lipoprotein 17-related variable surface protein n=1 Tax=Metamycoplasma hyosynoviae TaxID=29559 RepID=UPI002359A5E5|nr:lipoprotein 17-related variable surface protein [Metamycoplasma hyosynoviae]MDC8916692.1 hypothetical protein [Metamycoplasma hyosynoviae]MDD1360294.1 hypothetical protein [Metamycoplasma hyosynoviae]